MPFPWEAEKTISSENALQIISQQFPALNPSKIAMLGKGWDNTAYLINDEYIFRFPRRSISVSFIENELNMLPKIASMVPLPIPEPKWHGKATEDYPWPFSGYRKLAGATACQLKLSDQERVKLAEPLAYFLKSLHGIPLSLATGNLPGDVLDRLNIERLLLKIDNNLKEMAALNILNGLVHIPRLLEEAPAIFHRETPVIVHGDLYVRHLLLDPQNKLCGIIDWGDIHLGNRAVDLAIVHSFLPMQSHEAFRNAYGEIGQGTWELARLRAIYHSTIMALYGYHSKDPSILREAIASLNLIER